MCQAVLSEKPQLLYNYFKQLFAQVTNPPIDAIREEVFTDTTSGIGPELNLIDPQPESCHPEGIWGGEGIMSKPTGFMDYKRAELALRAPEEKN